MANHILVRNDNTNRRASLIVMPKNNQIVQEAYDYEMKKLLEREHQMLIARQRPIDNIPIQTQIPPYMQSTNNEVYEYLQQPQATAHVNRQLLPMKSSTMSSIALASIKPLRIIIIRHAERSDAVLGSDWSKKSFDRSGRYIRFSEHLPEALPTRSYLHHYVIDVPLTNRGRMHALKTGKSLLVNGYAVDICYTSPSLRCVQTAHGILTGMNKKNIPMQLEPCLFECYLNDFKRTLCFMTKDELASNGYNIDKSYQAFMPFMRPHDSQIEYYERCHAIMNRITQRHQATGGTILIVAHAPSLEGLTRHLSGGKFQPEKLFDIARRVPFLAMTIIEKAGINSPWLFRTRPLNLQSKHETESDPARLAASVEMNNHDYLTNQHEQRSNHQQQKHRQNTSRVQTNAPYMQQTQQQHQNLHQIENIYREPITPLSIDLKKVTKSSTAPNLPVSNSLSEMFHVI